MKILYFTDAHLRSQSDKPKWRVDDHYVSQFEELKEIRQLAMTHNVDLMISGGDTIHYPNISHALVGDIITWCKTLPCVFYSVVGNHCCFAYRTADLKSSGLGVLFESGAIKKLDELILEEEKIIIRGIHVFIDPHHGNYMFDQKYDAYYKIIVTHNYITKDPQVFDHYLTRDVVTNANLVLSGHLHQGFYDEQKNTRFVNPGSLSRWSINEQHDPQVMLINTDDQSLTNIPLRCSKAATDIFDLTSAAELKSTEMNLQAFVDSLRNVSFNNLDIEQLVSAEGFRQQIPQIVIDKALQKIQRAKIELS